VFDEKVFPFAVLHSNAGALLRAEIELLPLSLHSINLHRHERPELHEEPVDVDPANATNNVAKSFLQISDHVFASDDESENSGHFGDDSPIRPGAGAPNLLVSGSSATSGSLADSSDARASAVRDNNIWASAVLSRGVVAR
jgi:hypothetical protein